MDRKAVEEALDAAINNCTELFELTGKPSPELFFMSGLASFLITMKTTAPEMHVDEILQVMRSIAMNKLHMGTAT